MDADKLKDFFIFHVEKMILAVVIGVTVLLVWKGLQLPNFMDKHQPERLSADATRVRGEIDDDHNDAIIPERKPDFDIVKRAEETRRPVPYIPYDVKTPWERTPIDSSIKRTDPMLVAPRELQAVGVLCSIAVRARPDTPYAIQGLEAADELEKVEARPVRRPPRRARRNMMMDEGGEMDDMMSEMMEEYGGSDMGSGMMMDSEAFGSAGGKRKFNPKYDFGYRPGPTKDMKTERPQIPVPEIAWFIAGTAVLPHKEMYKAYEAAFKEADGYNPGRRDTPAYFNFEVQRADVTDKAVGQLAEADWIARFDRLFYTRRAALLWSGYAAELVPDDYRDEAITTWIPPVLLTDYSKFSLHPLVPMKSKREIKEETVEVVEMDNPADSLFSDPEDGTTTELAGPAGSAVRGTMATRGIAEYGAMGRAGMFGAGIEIDPVDYKIMRFYDFVNPRDKDSPRPKRKYVYRLRIAVNDPNFPATATLQPPTRSLDPNAYKRVAELIAKAETEGKRSFQRWTDWSEPCDPVSLPSQEQYFAGPVTPASPKYMKVNNRTFKVVTKQPRAKIVASQFDFTYKARVPMLMNVTEGSVLSDKREFNDVVDPITLEVKKIPQAELVSGTTIIGLDGGHPLSIVEGDEMTEPGVMLLFDENGGLTVTDEVSDQESYRIQSFADERGE